MMTPAIPVSSQQKNRVLFAILACALELVVGLIDFLSGYELVFSAFYLLAIIPATWFGGKSLGFLFSILSVVFCIAGDFASGSSYLNSQLFVIWWNAFIMIAFYSVLVVSIDRLRRFYENLESQVRVRTQALMDEMAKRESLEKEILLISEHEQSRIGHDLHDTLCQHLTGTALASQVLHEKLLAKALPEASDAANITDLIEEGIGMTRDLAHGLSPVDVQSDGLIAALRSFANGISRRYGVSCEVIGGEILDVNDTSKALHLYRITQESVNNAIKHGGADIIRIHHSSEGGRIVLVIEDNGKGLPSDFRSSRGMGIRIMDHRASMIGAKIEFGARAGGGTRIVCIVSENDFADKIG